MNQIEKNVVHSFQKVRNDILRLQSDIAILTQNQQKIVNWINHMNNKEEENVRLIASKTGKSVHSESCPLGKRIKSKISFSNKSDAVRAGYELCKCLE